MSKINWSEVQKYPESAHRLVGAKNIKNYCMSGNAIVTLTSPTGVHYSYYIRAPWMKDKDEFDSDIRFVYVFGSEAKWNYLGELSHNGLKFRVTRNSYHADCSPEFKGMLYIVRMMHRDFETPMILQHEGCCGRCGRRLIDPVSIERGIGPKCYNLIYGGA